MVPVGDTVDSQPLDTPVGRRNNICLAGQGAQTLVFSHGFGCDKTMWRQVAPAFTDRYRVALYDHVGSGNSDLSAYSTEKYSSLTGYADDAAVVCMELGGKCIFVGHSVSAMIGAEAVVNDPRSISELIMVGPSPCYLNDGDYHGGFERADIDDLLETLEANYLGWARRMAPVIMGRPDSPEYGQELEESFCRMDPEIAARFARVTFLSDSRALLPLVTVPTLVIQCSDDIIAPIEVGQYTKEQLAQGELVCLTARGHCPNLSAPEETVAVIDAFLSRGRTSGDV
jgi:sigma-B regulation protein RsbQ